jgi:hypothetical protein
MHASHGNGTTLSGAHGGRMRRWLDRLADRLSPSLRCDACGVTSKRRAYRVTGAVRNIDVHTSPWTPWAVCECELICPHCDESVWEISGNAGSGLSYM